jgi:hypothetical protein
MSLSNGRWAFSDSLNRSLVMLSHLPPRLIPVLGLALAPDDPFINRFLVESPDPSDAYCWDLTVGRVLADGNLVQLQIPCQFPGCHNICQNNLLFLFYGF